MQQGRMYQNRGYNNYNQRKNVSNGNEVVWQVFSILLSIWDWMYGITCLFAGIGMFYMDYRIAITFLFGSLIISPVIVYKKGWTERGKFLNKIIRFLIGFTIVVLGLIMFFEVIPNV